MVKQLLDEHGERVGAYRVFSRGDDVLPVRVHAEASAGAPLAYKQQVAAADPACLVLLQSGSKSHVALHCRVLSRASHQPLVDG